MVSVRRLVYKSFELVALAGISLLYQSASDHTRLRWSVMAFVADRTNGRAYATVLRPSVVVCRRRRLSVCNVRYVLWLNGAS